MTQQATQITEETVRELSRRLKEPEWLRTRRVDAWRAFEAMSMPTGEEEEWRRTDLSGFDLEGSLSRLSIQNASDNRQTIVSPLTGDTGESLKGEALVFTDLSQAARSHEDVVREYLHSLVQPTEWKLQALQAALWSRGTFIYVPPGAEVAVPLQQLSRNNVEGAPMFNHVLVVAEENSSVTIIQESVSDDSDQQSLVSGAVEIVQRPNSRVRWFDVQRWGHNAYNFSTVRARLDKGAELFACNIGVGGRLTKARIEAILEGEGSRADLSDLLYKAALTGHSSEVWYGTVRIHTGATASDANQTSRNLLLSATAKAAPIPVLEIEQYDILRCSHGATAGPVDEEQLFYLESRGIEHDEAERMLVDAFFQEVLDRIPDEAVRQRVQSVLVEKLEKAGKGAS
jgi:Fe-S cluster assembly protein SufD